MARKAGERGMGSGKARAIAAAKPRADGYSAAYRMKLEQEFLVEGRMHRLPRWMKESVSLMLKEIENLRAQLAERTRPTSGTIKEKS